MVRSAVTGPQGKGITLRSGNELTVDNLGGEVGEPLDYCSSEAKKTKDLLSPLDNFSDLIDRKRFTMNSGSFYEGQT